MDSTAAGEGPDDATGAPSEAGGEVPLGARRLVEVDAAEGRLAEIAGVVHGGHGALVAFMVDALTRRLWEGWQIHSPAQWLAWKSGLSNRQARQVVQVAERAHELPVAVGALVAGELSLDAVRLIAAHVPARFDAAVTELARSATVAQLERVLPRYHFEDEAAPDDRAGGRAGAGADANASADDRGDGAPDAAATAAADGAPADPAEGAEGFGPSDRSPDASADEATDASGGAPPPSAVGGAGGTAVGPGEKRRVSFWWDDAGNGHLSACLPTDEAMVLEAALKAARTDLVLERRAEAEAAAGATDGEVAGRVTEPDVLLRLARSYLAEGRSSKPGADRYLIHAHLEQRPGGAPVLRDHLGPIVPDALRRLVTCDADVRPVWARDGVALSVGRTERLVPDRARRVIEHRDGGCVVPGCGRRSGLDVHHIRHWEDEGETDTHNLCCLCRRHHRQHHRGLLAIEGNADEPGGLVVKDRWGRVLEPAGAPEPVRADGSAASAADRRGVPHPIYDSPFGDRLNGRDVWLAPGPPPSRSGPSTRPPGEPQDPPARRSTGA